MNNWKPGDRVSRLIFGTLQGGTVREFTNRATGEKFLKISVSPTGKLSRLDDGWMLGIGTREGPCLECGRRYRWETNNGDGFCPACCRAQGRLPDATAQSRTEHLVQLRGNATRAPRVTMAASAESPHDPDESPF